MYVYVYMPRNGPEHMHGMCICKHTNTHTLTTEKSSSESDDTRVEDACVYTFPYAHSRPFERCLSNVKSENLAKSTCVRVYMYMCICICVYVYM